MNAGLTMITSTGKYDRSMIMARAHARAKRFMIMWDRTEDRLMFSSYAEAFKSALFDVWAQAGGELAIWQARAGQTTTVFSQAYA